MLKLRPDKFFNTLSDLPSSSRWNPTGTQATSTYFSHLGFPLHLSSPSHQKTEQKVIWWTTSSRLASSFRTNRKSDIRSVKNFLWSLNCISLVGLIIFSWQEWSYTVCRSVRTVRIAKVMGVRKELFTLRKLHLISWQESVDTVCRSKEIARIAKLVYLRGVVGLLQDFFWQSSSARAPRSLVQLLGGEGLKLVRLRCQGKD